jgi:hypothetical protein
MPKKKGPKHDPNGFYRSGGNEIGLSDNPNTQRLSLDITINDPSCENNLMRDVLNCLSTFNPSGHKFLIFQKGGRIVILVEYKTFGPITTQVAVEYYFSTLHETYNCSLAVTEIPIIRFYQILVTQAALGWTVFTNFK